MQKYHKRTFAVFYTLNLCQCHRYASVKTTFFCYINPYKNLFIAQYARRAKIIAFKVLRVAQNIVLADEFVLSLNAMQLFKSILEPLKNRKLVSCSSQLQ